MGLRGDWVKWVMGNFGAWQSLRQSFVRRKPDFRGQEVRSSRSLFSLQALPLMSVIPLLCQERSSIEARVDERRVEVVFFSIMKSANVADLRNNFRVIASWIADGESVVIKKRGHPFATLVPSAQADARPMPQIDFAGRLKKIWGDRVFSDEEVAEMRRAELEGEEG